MNFQSVVSQYPRNLLKQNEILDWSETHCKHPSSKCNYLQLLKKPWAFWNHNFWKRFPEYINFPKQYYYKHDRLQSSHQKHHTNAAILQSVYKDLKSNRHFQYTSVSNNGTIHCMVCSIIWLYYEHFRKNTVLQAWIPLFEVSLLMSDCTLLSNLRHRQ